jgi:alkylated DNA repair protein (DNA oxidative demethylase)
VTPPRRPGPFRPAPRPPRRPGRVGGGDPSYLYLRDYVGDRDRAEVLAWLATLHPLWEMRYSTRRPPPAGRDQRQLLRPVYWLGNWQFACLGYFTPPRGLRDRCVAAEPYPPPLARWVADIERRVRADFPSIDVPRGWHLNTCLVNFYGSRREGERWVDVARVGEHRDAEPGPVASISLGERALFQFVARGAGRPHPVSHRAPERLREQGGGGPSVSLRSPGHLHGQTVGPVRTQWLDDGSLQVFAGPRWKDQLLHRVQRVDTRLGALLPPSIDGFRTRRINFTFRYVPTEHVVPLGALSSEARADVVPYVAELAERSRFWRAALADAAVPPIPDGTRR